MTINLAECRRSYIRSSLSPPDLQAAPLDQFPLWFDEAREIDQEIENAMTLATVDAQGMPSVRTVLLKAFNPDGFVFFTHYLSQKGRDLAANPQAALLFQWLHLERQIRVQGTAHKLTPEESARYFVSRPRGSQLAVWAAQQSTELPSRAALEQSFQTAEDRFADQAIPAPEDWGGFCVRPEVIEFWQGRDNRLHDRFVYRRQDEQWQIQRLAP